MTIKRHIAMLIVAGALFPAAVIAQSPAPGSSGAMMHGKDSHMMGSHAMQGSSMHNAKTSQSHMKNGQAMKSGHMMSHPAPKST